MKNQNTEKKQNEKTLKEIEILKEENEQLKNQALRAMADLQNYRKRAETEKHDFIKYASKEVITSLLPVIDNFKRAFENLPEDIKKHEWVLGVSQIEKNFLDILSKEELTEISPKKGDKFNPDLQESIMVDTNTKEGIIGECYEKGYKLKDKVLRYAKVSVGAQN